MAWKQRLSRSRGQLLFVVELVTKRICCAACLAVVGSGILVASIAGWSHAMAAGATDLVVFDLPAQPLATAIERYSVITGWQIIYDSDLATGRRSAPVKGAFAPAVALRMLLAGTDLSPEYMAVDGAMLVPDPMAAARPAIAPEPPPHIRDYYGRIQVALERAFCADDLVATGAYRISIGFWIESSGSVTRMAALGSTGRRDVDAAFERAVRRLAVGPPPDSFAQPVVILVTPDLPSQCQAAGLRPARQAR